MMISCNEAADICTKKQYKEASLFQTMKLRLHILICKSCAQFSVKNSKLTSLCEQAHMKVLNEVEKESMKKALKEKL